MTTPVVVHLCTYSSHNSLQIGCDKSWTTPKWGTDAEQRTEIEGVYVADDDRRYTFTINLVTCPTCLDPAPKPLV